MNWNHLEAIFFDAGNTLLRVHPSVGAIYSDAARLFGVNLEVETIENTFRALWSRTAPLVNNEGHRLGYENEKEWWKFLVRRVFDELAEFPDFDEFFEYLYSRFAEADSWRLYEDVQDTLQELQSRGYRMGIISNWDSRLPHLCEALGIRPFFETMIVSALVGYEKPHPSIFQKALEETGLAPETALYIGDDPYLDYQAARNVGLHALHLDRLNRYADHDGRITSLPEILPYL